MSDRKSSAPDLLSRFRELAQSYRQAPGDIADRKCQPEAALWRWQRLTEFLARHELPIDSLLPRKDADWYDRERWRRWDNDMLDFMHVTQARISARAEGAQPNPDADKPTEWYHGERSYSLDGLNPKNVSKEQHDFLQAFLDKITSLTTTELKQVVTNPADVVNKLVKKFGEHPQGPIRRPKEKGDGYFIRVRSLPEKPC